MRRVPSTTAWLWWLALIILVMGTVITWMLSLGDVSQAYPVKIRLGVAFTAVGFGICVISATANWWINR